MQRFKGSGSSFNNLPGGGIQGGYIVFIHKEEKNSVPIAWSSTGIKRVARSTLATGALALTDACDALHI